MSISEIKCADDLAALAREAVEQGRIHKEYRDLIGAVLMANHVADWHYIKDLNRKFGTQEREAMKTSYPEWNILRELANGTKHCKSQATQDTLQWRHADFWGSPGHGEVNLLDWFVDFEGQPRSVFVLIETFLKKFEDKSSRPR